KLERVCNRLELEERDHLLDIGCGWGELAIFAAATRGCRVTAVTVSRRQEELARQRVHAAGLSDRVDIRLCDYRDLPALGRRFDKISSVEMIEAVGAEYLPIFFSVCAAVLAPGGQLALQAILMPEERYASYCRSVDWTQTYIFPGSSIPSL